MAILTDLRLSRKPLMGFVAIGLAWAAYFAQMPVIKANVGASDGAYGLAILWASFGALGAMWLAPACRKIAGARAVSLAILLLAGGMFWAGATGSLLGLTFALLLASVGSGVVDVLVNARTSEIEAQSGAKLMNLNHALYSFAYAGGALLTAFLRSADVPPVPVFGALAIMLALLAWGARDEVPDVSEEISVIPAGTGRVLVILAGLVVLTAFLAEAATEGWSALHLERTLGGSAGEGALGPALLGLMMGIGRMCGHSLSKRFRDTYLMLSATLVSAAGITLAGLAPTVGVALFGFAIGGLGISVVVPLAMALIGRMVPPAQRLAAISRASVIGYGAFFFGPPLMGVVAQGFGLRMAFVLIALLLVATALVLIPALARRSV